MPNTASPRRVCFVTVGATAGFRPLVDEVRSAAFRARLADRGFTDLVVQCGPDYQSVREGEEARAAPPSSIPRISCLAYTDQIGRRMAECRAGRDELGERLEGVIICHAGTGSIMDALAHGAKLIAVPNPSLMDNHQQELAEQMEIEGHLIWGKLGSLVHALDAAVEDLSPPEAWPPAHYQKHTQYPGGIYDIIDTLMRPTPSGS